MAALSYKGRFVEYVENGLNEFSSSKKIVRVKKQTIRNFRKHPIKVGETLYHYYGMRTKWCKKLGESICTSVHKIVIRKKSITILFRGPDVRACGGKINIAAKLTTKTELDSFAYADGFDDWETMRKWWSITHGENCFPFVGQLIKW